MEIAGDSQTLALDHVLLLDPCEMLADSGSNDRPTAEPKHDSCGDRSAHPEPWIFPKRLQHPEIEPLRTAEGFPGRVQFIAPKSVSSSVQPTVVHVKAVAHADVIHFGPLDGELFTW